MADKEPRRSTKLVERRLKARRSKPRSAAPAAQLQEPPADGLALLGHDLLQPLLAARLCLAALTELDNRDRAQRLLSQVDQSLSAVEEQLIGALEVAKLESGATAPDPIPIALAPMLKAMQMALLPLALRKGIELTHTQTRLAVMSDPRLLRRILQNLVANAIRYTERGRVRVLARASNGDVRIEIWDSGPGIEEEERAILFDAFRRGRSAKHGVDGGQGLGLTIVRRLADRLGHKVGFFSHPGRGSCFWIKVPAPPAGLPRESVKTTQHSGLSLVGARVLIIEPDTSARSALRLLFSSWACETLAFDSIEGFETHHARSAVSADLLLADLDAVLPKGGQNGLERLRKAMGREVPAIVFSSTDEGEPARRAARSNADILATPIRPAALRALVTHLVG